MIYLDEQKSSAILVKTSIERVLSALEISTVVSYENSSEYSYMKEKIVLVCD